MRKLLLAMVVLAAVPAILMAYPPNGSPAPSFTIPDTADVMHTLPGDYAGHVLHFFFWQHG
jgi:hypothetical protein